ncbi:DoxX family protein [bacterium SCSIO 12741]|nr:DoxX family protein [bacterium SCSIO 12741]
MYDFRSDNWPYLLCLWAVCYVFSLAGLTKFTPAPAHWPDNFKRWNLPIPLIYVIGFLEFTGAFALLFPAIQQMVIWVLGGIMVAALSILALNREAFRFLVIPMVILTLLTLIHWMGSDASIISTN